MNKKEKQVTTKFGIYNKLVSDNIVVNQQLFLTGYLYIIPAKERKVKKKIFLNLDGQHRKICFCLSERF